MRHFIKRHFWGRFLRMLPTFAVAWTLIFQLTLPCSAAEYTLLQTADQGTRYLDQMVFFGESTTAHLRARGVLTGGTSTAQVWCDNSGTRTLTSKITSEPIIYPKTGELLTVGEACAREQPAYLVLSFGLNGIMGFVKNPDSYIRCYGKLIDAIKDASPETKIILQTVYPVLRADSFSVDADTLNGYIAKLNGLLPTIAAMHENVRVADTASVLRDSQNRLSPALADADGIHLLTPAYQRILLYLRTHAWL